jgi:hypothetical protein
VTKQIYKRIMMPEESRARQDGGITEMATGSKNKRGKKQGW